MDRRNFCLLASAAALSGIAPGFAFAQAWPSRPIRLVVPFPPGGGTDAISRQLADRLTTVTGWTFVLENRAGAGGNIGLDAVAKAEPDGYTIGMGQASNLAVNPALYAKMPFNSLTDFEYISLVSTQPMVVVVSSKSPIKSMADLVASAKANPGKISISHTGRGTIGHLAGEIFSKQADIKTLIVPYKGANQAMTDMISGVVDVLFANPLAAMPLVSTGSLRAIGVTSARRLPALPDVPTVEETGYPGFEANNWQGLVAPARTPAPIIAQLNAAVDKALKRPEMVEKLAIDGSVPFHSTSEKFKEYARTEHSKWGKVVREAGIEPQ